MIISFFGHSKFISNKEDETIVLKIIKQEAAGKPVEFYLGGYGNFDEFAKKCAKKYKEEYNNTKIYFITPYINKWLDIRKEYFEKEYDGIIYPPLENVPLKFAISRRNEWIINKSDYIIAYVNTHYGGAYNSLLYADMHNKKYTNIFKGSYELY